ncbi:hypothetical protein HK101_000786, partial [Irineochytrium annulatum]
VHRVRRAIRQLLARGSSNRYARTRRDQALAEYLAKILGLAVVLVVPGQVGLESRWLAVAVMVVLMVFSVGVEWALFRLEMWYGFPKYQMKVMSRRVGVALLFKYASITAWLLAGIKAIFATGPWPDDEKWFWE